MPSEVLLLNVPYDYPNVTEGVFSGINKIWQPISLAYAKSMLKKEGVESTLIDANAMRIKPLLTGSYALGKRLVFVSTSSYDRWECPHLDLKPIVECCKSIRCANKGCKIVLLGSHATVRPEHMLKITQADAAIVGEPENAIVRACLAKDIRDSPSMAWTDSKGILRLNPPAEPVDLDLLDAPDFSGLPMKKYGFDMLGESFAVVEASRGCPFKCNYCLKSMFGDYRQKSLENCKRDILDLVENYGVKNINFVDLEFTINRKHTMHLCRWMVDEGLKIKWSCQTRLDTVDDKLLSVMKESGCSLIMYGVESADQKMLDSIGKAIKLEDIRRGIRQTRNAKIDSLCFFMFGFPKDSRPDWEATLDFAISLNPDYASFFACRPYPGTQCYESSKDISEGVFPPAVGETQRLMELKDFTETAFSRFYFRPTFMIRRIIKADFGLLFRQARLFLHKRGWMGDG